MCVFFIYVNFPCNLQFEQCLNNKILNVNAVQLMTKVFMDITI